MNIREFYVKNYPTDELGSELNGDATLRGLFICLIDGVDVYEYIGVGDSIVRERLFEKIAEEWNISYDSVYQLWINN
ncbi:MAG: hypothetical protein RLZZ196_3230 [Bacteroidota bacterium]|jgi:hypothetical protein